MSDPKIDFQQLLSDHLDGWLSGDDLETLEQQLRDDPGLRRQYESMVADRESLRALFSQSPTKQLPSDFARSVTAQAARRRNEVDGLNTPVPADGERSVWRRRIAIASAIATAAALLLMFSLPKDEGVVPNQLADNSSATIGEMEMLRGPGESDSVQPDVTAAVPTERLADAQIDSAAMRPANESESIDTPAMPSTAKQPNGAPNPAEKIAARRTPESSEVASSTVESSGSRRSMDVSSAVAMSQSPDDTLSGAVLVYDVRLTSRGRVTQPLSLAMRDVGLAATTRQPIDRSLIEAAKSVETFDPESKFQVLYLRASAKRLDRLFETLLRDSENVSSVALSLVTDSPILKLTDNLERVDSTLIQREDRAATGRRAVSYQLESDRDNELAVLRRLLDDQSYIPVTPGLTGLPRAEGSNEDGSTDSRPDLNGRSGRDIMSRVLVIIR